MKNFYKFTLVLVMLVFIGIIMLTHSCTTDKCKATACANFAPCVDGVCKCLPGYTGATCDTESRLNFLGIWNVTETGTTTGNRSYSIKIEKDTFVTGVVIINLYNYFSPIKALINKDTITIYNQQKQGKVVVGTGRIISGPIFGDLGEIDMKYEVIDTATQLVDDFGVYTPVIHTSTPSRWTR